MSVPSTFLAYHLVCYSLLELVYGGYVSIIGEVTANLSTCRLIGNLGEYLEMKDESSYSSYTFSEFLGIPFADAPTGELRFRYPVMRTLKQEFRANSFGPGCVQPSDNSFSDKYAYSDKIRRGAAKLNVRFISEDCLSLNIWTPYPLRTDSEALLPVMIWIHGGGFHSGSSQIDLYRGHRLAALENVVVVTFNYRVGVFGFLYLHDTDAPGNAGLFDQVLAMKWVQQNIRSFGGNPEQITLFGQDAGAASVGIHLLSPMSQGLFNRAILQSGSPTAPWAVLSQSEMRNRSETVAAQLNCKFEDTSLMATCLKNVPYRKLTTAESVLWKYNTERFLPFPVGPIVDRKLLTNSPYQILTSGNFRRVPLMVGSNSNEGSFSLIYHLSQLYNVNSKSLLDSEDVEKAMFQLFGQMNPLLFDQIKFMYRNWTNIEDREANRLSADIAVGDQNFVCPTTDFASFFAQGRNRVYMYQLQHRASTETWPEWMGVIHGADVEWVFGNILDEATEVEEKSLNRRIIKYWANFAKTSNPNRGHLTIFEQEHWSRWTATRQKFMVLNTSYPTSITGGPNAKKCALWNSYLPLAYTFYEDFICPAEGWIRSKSFETETLISSSAVSKLFVYTFYFFCTIFKFLL